MGVQHNNNYNNDNYDSEDDLDLDDLVEINYTYLQVGRRYFRRLFKNKRVETIIYIGIHPHEFLFVVQDEDGNIDATPLSTVDLMYEFYLVPEDYFIDFRY